MNSLKGHKVEQISSSLLAPLGEDSFISHRLEVLEKLVWMCVHSLGRGPRISLAAVLYHVPTPGLALWEDIM